MSIFSSIVDKIFHRGGTPAAGSAPATAAPTPATAGATASPATAGAATSPASGSAPAAVPAQTVDVEAVLNGLATQRGEKLNWRTSIVDLMKLLDLDSGLPSRKQLAGELGYSGDTNDSATMNIWLHQQVMRKLAENGGKVPADLH